MSNIIAAKPATVAQGDGATTEVFTEIDHIYSGPSGLGATPNIQTVRFHPSTGDTNSSQNIPTYVDNAALTFSVYFDGTNLQHRNLVEDAFEGTMRNYKYTDASGVEFAFLAATQITKSSPPDDMETMDVTLTPQEAPVRTYPA